MSADIMLVCTARNETYRGLRMADCLMIGLTGDKGPRFASMVHRRVLDTSSDIGGFSMSTFTDDKFVHTEVSVEWRLDKVRFRHIMFLHRKYNGSKFVSREDLKNWLLEHVDDYIGVEFW